MYIVQGFGDLPTKAPNLFETPRVFHTLEAALLWLVQTMIMVQNEYPLFKYPDFWFDPEDDRIVIWEAKPSYDENRLRVVWHASGWHWQGDASDLFGGPLDQGVLPGYTRSLYDLAMSE